MIYFLTIYSAVAALSFTDFIPKLRKFGALMCIILLAMLAGWRNMGGSDFYVYQDIYYGLTLNYMSAEAGYAIINNLFSGLGFSYNAFLFVYSLAAISIMVIFLEKHVKYPKFALLFYMACYFFFYNMVLNRQMLCMSMSLWVIYFWDKNKLYSLLCLLTGFLFHQSIIVLLPLLLVFEVLKHTKGIKYWLLFFVAAIGFTALINPQRLLGFMASLPGLSSMSARLLNYLENAGGEYSLNIVEYIKMGLALIIILPFIKKILADKGNHIWAFFYFFGIIFLFWTRNIEILFRVFAYFDLSLLVLIPYAVNIVANRFSPSQRKPFLILTYAAVGALSIMAILYRAANFGDGSFFSYQFYFMDI